MATSLIAPSSMITPLQSSTPLLMTGRITIPANSPVGLVKGPDDTISLVNTDSAPMVVNGIRFQAQDSIGRIFRPAVRIKLGNSPLTNGFVHILALCPPLDLLEELVSGFFTWRFQKPLILWPAERLLVETQLLTATDGVGQSFFKIGLVGWAGSTLSKLPLTRDVPYASAFLGAPRDEKTAGIFSEQSSEGDLGNPFAVPLYAEAFTGRFLVAGVDMDDPVVPNGFPIWPTWRDCQIRMEDSNGDAVQRTPVPFSAAFDFLRRRWPIKTWLPPKHFFIARIDGNYAAPVTAAANLVQPLIGLVGYRTERV